MKFVITTQELNYLIGKVLSVVPQKPTIPILSNICLQACNDELLLMATDLTVGICCFTEAKITEEGGVALPAKVLSQLVRELTVTNIEVSVNQNQVTTIQAGGSKFKLHGMAIDLFPHAPEVVESTTIIIKQKNLKELLYSTAFTVSKEDTRYVLTGLLLKIERGELTFVGTDGKRLGLSKTQVEIDPSFHAQLIIPLKTIDEILKNLSDEGDAKLSILSDKINIELNQVTIFSKLLTGEFPDYQRIIPSHLDTIVNIHREELMTLLRQISLFVTVNNLSARFIFENGELRLITTTMEIGEGEAVMAVNYFGPKLEIALSPTGLLEILRHCKEEIITIGFIDAYNPGIIVDGECTEKLQDSSSLFIIMPMRLSEA